MAPEALKIKLFKSAIKMIAAYALESLPLNPAMSNMLDAGHRQMIHAALGINWQNNITNEEAYGKSSLLPFSQTIRKRRLHMIGHSLRLQNRSTTPLGSMLQNILITPWTRSNVDLGEGFAQRSERNWLQHQRCY